MLGLGVSSENCQISESRDCFESGVHCLPTVVVEMFCLMLNLCIIMLHNESLDGESILPIGLDAFKKESYH